MKKFKLFPLILIFCLALSAWAPAALALDEPGLAVQAAVLADLDSGRIIYSKNMDEQRSPASLTKIMTGLLAIEAVESGQCSMDEMDTAPADCQQGMDSSSSNASIVSGEEMSFGDYIKCALIHSANDACNVIAVHVAGSIDAFVAKMNERAAALGCTSTSFADPNGLSSSNKTTAYDLYLITKEAIKHEQFMNICNTEYVEIPATNVNPARSYYSSNALLTANGTYGSGYVYEYAAGVKTGFTQAAGYCLVSTAEKDGVRVLAIVLGGGGVLNTGASTYDNFADSVKLYNWVFDNFSYREVVSAADPLVKVTVQLAEGDGSANLRAAGNASLLLPNDVDETGRQLECTVYEDRLVAPIEAGTVLGQASIIIDGVNYGTIDLVTNTKIEMSKTEFLKQQLGEIFHKGWVKALIIVVAILLIGYIALVMRYRSLRRKHLKEKKRAEQRRRQEREQMYRRDDKPAVKEPTQRINAAELEGQFVGLDDFDSIMKEYNAKDKD